MDQSDARPTGDQEVVGSIPAGSAAFCHSPRSADSRRAVVSIPWLAL